MNIVDGRTDRDKLLELLQQQEQTHLEFKRAVDLQTKQGKAIFVKDIVALANSDPGGYMVVGVADDGKPCQRSGELGDLALYDGARLSDLIHGYIEAAIQVVTQPHTIDGYDLVLILARPPQKRLPVPFSKHAQFKNEATNRMETVFRIGDIVRRENAKVAPIRWAHWEEILEHRDAKIRAEARASTDSLINELITEFRSSRKHGTSPQLINPNLAPNEFIEAVESYFESGTHTPLTKVIHRVSSTLRKTSTFETGLQQLSVLAVNALLFREYDVYSAVIDELYDTYNTQYIRDPKALVRYVSYIYVIGSCAVRLKRWREIQDLVVRPVDVSDHYRYPSWIRHAQVEATRNSLFDHKTLMISDARYLQVSVPGLAPDLEPAEQVPADELSPDDELVNSLCQFDLLYCTVVALTESSRGEGYPASSMMAGERSLPIIADLMQDDRMWQTLFPQKSRSEGADSILHVLDRAREEARRTGRWWHPPRTVGELLSFGRYSL